MFSGDRKIKKHSILILVIIALLAGTDAEAKYSGGTGEPNDPYQIGSAGDLLTLTADTNDYNKCFILTEDIDLQGQVFTTAIIAADTVVDNLSFDGTKFTGTFDGNGYKILNVTINGGINSRWLGLFGYIGSGSLIKNLGFENCAVSGYYDVGGLAGWNYDGNINNCHSTAVVSGDMLIGGLVGVNKGSIINCYSAGTVTGWDGSNYIGGLVGYNEAGIIIGCYSNGAVKSTNTGGGLVGFNLEGTVTKCCSTGTISGDLQMGGLLGYTSSGSISNCYSTGNVSGDYEVGGLVGFTYSDSISNCYSTGTVSGDQKIGGLVGNNCSYISNCYSTGAVSGNTFVGGLIGENYGSVVSSFWDTQTSDWWTSAGGTGKTTSEMKMSDTFIDAGWDFVSETINGPNDIWRMCVDGVEYPLLSWQFAPDFTCPDGVDILDLAFFTERWLTECNETNNFCNCTDVNCDDSANFLDFLIFANNWLEDIEP